MRDEVEIIPREVTFVVRWAIVGALGILLISMATGQSGITNYMELLSNRDELWRVTQELSARNQLVQQRIADLKTSREAQVRYVKEEFGYVEPGEVIYHFSPGQTSTRQASAHSISSGALALR